MKPMSGRIVGVFGLPCSGKSTIINALIESSRELLVRVSSGDIVREMASQEDKDHMADGDLFSDEDRLRAELIKKINIRRGQGAEIIFLDGFPRTPNQIKWMMDNQLAGTEMEGYFIQVKSDINDMIKRVASRNRDEQDDVELIKKKIKKQSKLISEMDNIIFMYGIPYFTIINIDLERAIINLAKIVGLRK